MQLIDDRDEFIVPDWDIDTPISVITQTTLSVEDTNKTISNIKNHFKNVIVRNDLCYATTNRQLAVKEICQYVDLFLVIGAENSSNCNRLREVAENNGVPSYLINNLEDLDNEWLRDVQNVGITSGASTPEKLVQDIIDYITPDQIMHMGGNEENITFNLPLELR
jgi:4-hydroxy-3-methylbut-2-enyl diphosphate reductase